MTYGGAAVLAVADNKNAVVELGGRAGGLVVDTGGVELEALVRGINGNRDGANRGGGRLKARLGAGLDVSVAGEGGANVGRREVAGAVTCSVRVASLGVNAVLYMKIIIHVC